MSAGGFDAGLQPERTELAWRRTALGLGVGSIVAIRLFPAWLGHPAWGLIGVVGAAIAGGIWWAARRRSARITRMLLEGLDRLPGAGTLFALCVVVVAVGTTAGSLVVASLIAW
jgi:uncharacterized membrane protein YidH (DUF202 family)